MPRAYVLLDSIIRNVVENVGEGWVSAVRIRKEGLVVKKVEAASTTDTSS